MNAAGTPVRCDACRFYRGGGARGVCTTADIEAWAEAGEWVEVEAQLWVAPDHYCAEWRPW